MNDNSMEDAVRVTLTKLLAMSHEQLQSEMLKYQEGDFAKLFRIAREFDDNFMRQSSSPLTGSNVWSEELLQRLEQWINYRIEQQVEKSLAKVLPK